MKRTTIEIDEELLARAKRALRPDTTRATVEEALRQAADRAEGEHAARAVGSIMGSNPIPVIVSCHRVLAADGLGGFGGGLEVKM